MQSYAGKTEVNDLPSANTANASTITPAKMKTRYFSVGLLKKKKIKIAQRCIYTPQKIDVGHSSDLRVIMSNYLYFSGRNRFFLT